MLRSNALAFFCLLPIAFAIGQVPDRVARDLQVLYDFKGTDNIVRDRSGIGQPIDLRIKDTSKVLRTQGALEVIGNTQIRSHAATTKVSKSVKQSCEITVEAWIRPTKLGQTGPARIVTISKDTSQRNVTLGQENESFQVRFRTSTTNSNGLPGTVSPVRPRVLIVGDDQ